MTRVGSCHVRTTGTKYKKLRNLQCIKIACKYVEITAPVQRAAFRKVPVSEIRSKTSKHRKVVKLINHMLKAKRRRAVHMINCMGQGMMHKMSSDEGSANAALIRAIHKATGVPLLGIDRTLITYVDNTGIPPPFPLPAKIGAQRYARQLDRAVVIERVAARPTPEGVASNFLHPFR
eukprot:5571441-Amphidinium_carterae.1